MSLIPGKLYMFYTGYPNARTFALAISGVKQINVDEDHYGPGRVETVMFYSAKARHFPDNIPVLYLGCYTIVLGPELSIFPHLHPGWHIVLYGETLFCISPDHVHEYLHRITEQEEESTIPNV